MTITEERIEQVSSRAEATLREFGFGAHESSVILALNQRESATVADLSSATGIHHANLYSVLDGLVYRGLVIEYEGRPRRFEFTPLTNVRDLLSTKLDQLILDMERIQQERETKELLPTLIYTIRGRSVVESKMQGMVSRASERVLLVTPSMDMFDEPMHAALRTASERGVQIRLIVAEVSEEPDYDVKQRIKDDTLAVNLVVDGAEALISMPDLSVCGWADNALISLQLEGFLEQTWNMSR
ncbi:MAG: TrmB family transcriptional regulator [Candidatus Thorarchaeota archaeon]|jgi:sugar-specific transcriptional regulator TrmB